MLVIALVLCEIFYLLLSILSTAFSFCIAGLLFQDYFILGQKRTPVQ